MRTNEDASTWDTEDGPSDVRIAILSSHEGRHLQTLLEHPVVRKWVALIVADRPDAYSLRHAEWHGIPGVALRTGKSNLDLFDVELARILKEHLIDYVVVAGFPRVVGTKTVQSYPDRIAKVHHSLLPAFPGSDPISEALRSAAKETGVTIHLITGNLEAGPILSQQSIEIHDDDTWHSLVERIHEVEVRLLPTAVLDLVGDGS